MIDIFKEIYNGGYEKISIVIHNPTHCKNVESYFKTIYPYLPETQYYRYMQDRGYKKILLHFYKISSYSSRLREGRSPVVMGFDKYSEFPQRLHCIIEMNHLRCRKP